MSFVFLQVGQCGIQVGQSLAQALETENISSDHLNYPLNSFKQLLIDTEHKTWSRRKRTKSMLPSSVLTLDASGRGNNWAHGFTEDKDIDQISNEFRRLVEQDSCFGGTLILSSVAGGTGSGLGSRILEEISLDYPKKVIMNFPIIPFDHGETALQHYNGLLSLTWMQRLSDMISLSCNDHILHTVSKQKEVLGNTKASNSAVSLNDLNEYISLTISGMLLPKHIVQKSQDKLLIGDLYPFNGWDVIQTVTPIPSFKFAHMASSRLVSSISNVKRIESLAKWEDVSVNLNRNMLLDIPDFKPTPLFSILYSRGVQTRQFYENIPLVLKKINSRWGKSCIGQDMALDNSFLHGIDTKSQLKSLTLLSNTDLASVILDRVINNVKSKLKVRAYLHWYKTYMPDIEQEMLEAIETLTVLNGFYCGDYGKIITEDP